MTYNRRVWTITSTPWPHCTTASGKAPPVQHRCAAVTSRNPAILWVLSFSLASAYFSLFQLPPKVHQFHPLKMWSEMSLNELWKAGTERRPPAEAMWRHSGLIVALSAARANASGWPDPWCHRPHATKLHECTCHTLKGRMLARQNAFPGVCVSQRRMHSLF